MKKLTLEMLRPAAFALVMFLLVAQLLTVLIGARLASQGRADFRHLYTAGYMVRTGHGSEIYDADKSDYFETQLVGSNFPAFDHMGYETLFFVPFSLFSFKIAYFAFLTFNLLVLVVSTVILKPYIMGLECIGKTVPWALPFAFLPVGIALVLGQDSLILLVIMIGPFVLLEKGRDFAAGFVLALGLFKFQFVIPIALLFFLWRRWKVLGGALGGAILTGAISIWVTGFAAIMAFLKLLTAMSVHVSTDAEKFRYRTYPERMPNIRGLICAVAGVYSGKEIAFATIICSIAVFAYAARKKPSLPLAIVVAVLVSFHGFIPDASLLALPVAIGLSGALQQEKAVPLCAAAAVFITPTILFFLTGNNFSLMVIPIVALLLSGSTSTSSLPKPPTPQDE